jgi:hypothetical protein
MFDTLKKRMCYANIPLVGGKSILNFPVSDGWVIGAICKTKGSIRNRVPNPVLPFGGTSDVIRVAVTFGDRDCDSARSRWDCCSEEGE